MLRSVYAFCVLFAPAALLAAPQGDAPSPPLGSSWAEGAVAEGEARVEARLLLHPDRPAEGRVRAGLLFSLDPGWHLFWKNPGESGLPTRLAWRGGEAGPPSWPAPTAFEEADGRLLTYGYEGHVLLASELRLDATARSVGVDADLLVCRASCAPARFSLERSLDTVDSGEAAAAVRRLFELHDESLPLRAEALGVALEAFIADPERPHEVSLAVLPCRRSGAGEACTALAKPPAGPVFFSELPALRVLGVSDHPEHAGGLLLRLEAHERGPVRGVLALRGADGLAYDVAVDVTPSVRASRVDVSRFLAPLALGVLAGLLLNGIPCVLGVLGLKAALVAELARWHPQRALAQAAAYAAGSLATLLALAGVVWALRRAGWGFELDSPVSVAAVSALLVMFALDLLGVFEIGFLPGVLARVAVGGGGPRRSFSDGGLAVLLAAPCAAPLLAAGFAHASGASSVWMILAAIGCGLAAPLVLISVFPRSASWLPRPGPWMADVESVLGFGLLATVLWLLRELGRSAGADAVAGLLALLLAVAIAAWGYGRLVQTALRFVLLATGALLLLAGANGIAVEAPPPTRATPSREASVEAVAPASQSLSSIRISR